ncbi:hypothetical protein, partial [Rhizobium leguminosarum]
PEILAAAIRTHEPHRMASKRPPSGTQARCKLKKTSVYGRKLVYDKNEYLDVKLAILTEWEQYVLEGLGMWQQVKVSQSQKLAA